jgi:phosphoribosylaminoimidazole carboxylase PurE protein
MGSDSDLAVMKDAAEILQEFEIDYNITICSAHRLPEETARYATTAVERGLKVIIAGAGGAAHLPGVIAASTTLPVIGVPIQSGALAGVDALYAIVQMPRGIPVATVAINGSANAALLAVQMLALENTALRQALQDYRRKMGEAVLNKDKKLKQLGIKAYLEG